MNTIFSTLVRKKLYSPHENRINIFLHALVKYSAYCLIIKNYLSYFALTCLIFHLYIKVSYNIFCLISFIVYFYITRIFNFVCWGYNIYLTCGNGFKPSLNHLITGILRSSAKISIKPLEKLRLSETIKETPCL